MPVKEDLEVGEANPTEEYVGKTLTIYLLTYTKYSFVKHAASRFLVYLV